MTSFGSQKQIELKLMKLMSYVFGQRAEFQHRAIFADFGVAPRRGYMGWLQPLSKIEHDQVTRTSRHLDIRKRFDMKSIWKTNDRFYERFYERHWKTSWHWRVSVENGCLFHVCPPFFHIFSVTIFPHFHHFHLWWSACGAHLCSLAMFGGFQTLGIALREPKRRDGLASHSSHPSHSGHFTLIRIRLDAAGRWWSGSVDESRTYRGFLCPSAAWHETHRL